MSRRDAPHRKIIARAALAVACVSISGCASLGEQQMYVDWISVANPATICGGQADCVRHSAYRGRTMCTIVTADRNISYARLGEQVRECMKSPAPMATEVRLRHD